VSVKIVKLDPSGPMQVNDFPRPDDWVDPGTLLNGAVNVIGAGVVAIKVQIDDGTTTRVIRMGFGGRIIDAMFAYLGTGHAADAILVETTAPATIVEFPAGSATANAVLRAGVLNPGEAVFSDGDQISITMTAGAAADQRGLLTLFAVVEA
jgi:hypothetical protein